MKRAVLMGDPSYFSIRGGSNPHTRNRWGVRKQVDRERAIAQWHAMARLLTSCGAAVFVVPPDPDCPGMVYPANAGFLSQLDKQVPISCKTFYLANLIAARKREEPHYAHMLAGLGFRTERFAMRMEGEADFFRWGACYLFTCGRLERQRFVLRPGWPPYRRIYGFRSDRRLLPQLQQIAAPREVVQLELVNEQHYHGDTVFSAFGPDREFLLAWREGFSAECRERIERLQNGNIIWLSDHDRRLFAANSFRLHTDSGDYLFLPQGTSDGLYAAIENKGVTPVPVDVSEFLKKGGGSIKCMICDLGDLVDDTGGPSESVRVFRDQHLYRNRNIFIEQIKIF